MIANIVKIIILGEHKICIDEKSFLARNEFRANFCTWNIMQNYCEKIVIMIMNIRVKAASNEVSFIQPKT